MDDPVGKLQGVASCRDHVRTGLVWSVMEKNGGYSASDEPWLPGGQTICGRGVYEQINNPGSQLSFTRDIIALRKQSAALRFGKYVAIPYDTDDDRVLCFGRQATGSNMESLLMVFNFSDESKLFGLSREFSGKILRSTIRARTGDPIIARLDLQPHEGCIVSLAQR